MRLLCSSLCLSLLACTSSDDDWEVWLNPTDIEGALAVELGPAIGQGTIEVPVRLVNTYKASVPGTQLEVSVEGPSATLMNSTVTLDAHGRGSVWVETTGPEVFTVSVTASSDDADIGATSQGYSTAVTMPRYAMNTLSALDNSVESEPNRIANGTGGVTLSIEDELWWHPADGHPPTRVANLPVDVSGMVSHHIDSDGLLDLVTWGGSQVMLFRGVPGGGLSWGGSWIGEEGTVAGVAAADLDGNRTTDLAVALTGNGDGVVQLLSGTGDWDFEVFGRPLNLTHGIFGIAAADEGNDGRPVVTITAEDHNEMRRYTLTEDGWVGASTFTLSTVDGSECEVGSELLPLADLDGDGDLEVTISGPSDFSPHELVFFVLDDTVRHYPLNYEPYTVDIFDMNADGAEDITLLEDGTLHYIHYTGSDFKDDSIALSSTSGPVAAGDFDQDGDGDVAVAATGVEFTHGRINENGGWNRDVGEWNTFATSLLTDPLVLDIDDDGITEVYGLTMNGTQLQVSGWQLSTGADGVEMTYIGNAALDANTEAYELFRCANSGYVEYYALVGDAAGERLYRLTLSDSSVEVFSDLSTTGTIAHCANDWVTETYSPFLVIISDTSGNWTSYRRALGLEGSGTLGPIQDFTTLPNEFFGCTQSGCSMASLDIDQDGVGEIATMTANGLTVDWSDGSTSTYFGSGELTVADADGDGWEDLIATDIDLNRVWIYRNLGNGLAPPSGFHTIRGIGGTVHLNDLSGDGVPEMVFRDTDGRILLSDVTEADAASSW